MTPDVERPAGERPSEEPGVLLSPGAIFDGKYRIGRTIGQGAMAVVLEATHLNLEDRVAIKLLLPRWAEDPALVERFMREGRAATRIRSEHVVRVFDVGVAEGHPYLVMEYLEGSDLDHVVATDGPLEVTVAIDYLLQACEAIAEAHARGIVHRDLKPANLFLTRRADASACVKVLDFGISKVLASTTDEMSATSPTTVLGSPCYMSPEQMMASSEVDARADVWALGAMLHELLVGSPPFDGETYAALSAAILRDSAPPLATLRGDVPAAVEAAVLRCLEKEPARRFANVAELAAALCDLGTAAARASSERIARVLEGGTGKVSLPTPPPPPASVRAAPPPQAPSPQTRAEPVGSLLATVAEPPPARGRFLGYLIAVAALAIVSSIVVWMVVRNGRAVRAAEEQERARAAASQAAATATGAASGATQATSAMLVADAGPSATTSASASEVAARPTDAGAGEHVSQMNAPVPPRPPTHARGPRRGPRSQPHFPPLPDFPVPSADPQGEPSSRPIDRSAPTAPLPQPSAPTTTSPPSTPLSGAPARP